MNRQYVAPQNSKFLSEPMMKKSTVDPMILKLAHPHTSFIHLQLSPQIIINDKMSLRPPSVITETWVEHYELHASHRRPQNIIPTVY